MSDQRLLDRFARLCEISSPTGSERAIADAVVAELRDLGVEVEEDGVAGPARAAAGNLIARLPGPGEAWVSFFCHLDTVPHEGPIEVELADGVFCSRGETILGADNKAAVAVLLELAARHGASAPGVGIELVFTVAEEDGLRGAKELDTGALRAPFGFVLDHPSPIGEVITAAPTYQRLHATFEGIEAHSGVNPEEGRNAIAAAAAAISQMRLGRLDEEATANVGTVEGGRATNIVPAHCRLGAEARSLDEGKASEAIGALVDACTWAGGEHEVDVDVEVIEMFRGYRLPSSATPVQVARAALSKCGIAAREVSTGGGSDANALIASGYEAVLLANGTEAPHTPEETVAAARLVEMVGVCEAIATEVARC